MNKFFLMILVVLGLISCAKDDLDPTGGIYGIVTVKETAEPMRSTGVELYNDGLLLLKTVTYDDGHYEFENLTAGEYELKVIASGYVDVSYSVIVESGRTARTDMQLERLNTYMTVRTLAATEISGDKAILNGTYTFEYSCYQPSDVGFVYSISPSPSNGGTTITSSLTESFSNVINNLKKGRYYFQAYAKNSVGTEYGEILSFEISGQPIVTTLYATNVTETTATLNGRVDYEGDPVYSERGFVYSSSYPNPTIDDPITTTTKVSVFGNGKEFSANITGLTKNTTYFVRAYLINSAGTMYGDAIELFSNKDYFILLSDGIMVQKYDISSGSTWNSARNLSKTSMVGGYFDWRLPTIGECEAIYKKNISNAYYWTSESYFDDNFGLVGYYYYDFSSGKVEYSYSSNTYRVRCVRTLEE